jgi:hydroxyacylglutathione hydrolase
MTPQVEVIETPELGDRSYVVHDGRAAVVVDPQRDLDRVERVLAEQGLRCELVAETHVHNDYVTGGFALARRTGARYAVAAAEDVAFDRLPVSDGHELEVGGLRVRVVATPGHTPDHVSYIVDTGDGPAALCTGGSLLYGSVGRTDLIDPARTDELTRAQFRSARRLSALGDAADAVLPTHGFGSFCSSGSATGGDHATLADERRRNDALTEPDEDAFVARLVAGLSAYPAYYAHMGPLNRRGPAPADLTSADLVTPEHLHARIAAGEWVVDLRDRTAYAAGHLAGTLGFELGPQFATYVGWLIPWGTPLTLIGTTPAQVGDAQRQLARIGIDRPAGAAVAPVVELAGPDGLRDYPVVGFDELAKAGDVDVLDVRRDDERAAGAIPGSRHVPMHALEARLGELPRGPLWVHCASGYRAGIAASVLARAGHDVVLVDGDFTEALDLGLAL